MDRRTSLAALSALAGRALLPSVLEAWAQTTPSDWRPRAVAGALGPQLAALVDALLPETDTPGGRRVGVHVFIDLAVAECLTPDGRTAFVTGLTELNATCRSRHGADLDGVAPTVVAGVLREAEGRKSPFVKELKSLAVLGYATSQLGATRALAYDPSPGRYRGCVDLAPGQRAWAER
jgi:gluconate 2-dehydrogenase gamma chain